MGLYGPFTATVNTVQQCNISADAQGVYIVNTSRYDLAVAFQAGQPVNTTNFGGPPWYVVVPAGDRMGVQIPLAVYGASGFPGYVWVLPVDGTTSYATTGTTSNNDNFYLESFADVAQMPADYASAQFSNAASQQRVINVPVVPHINILSLGLSIAQGANTKLGPALATNIAVSQNTTVYIYSLNLGIRAIPWGIIRLGVAYYASSGGAAAGSTYVYNAQVLSRAPTVYTPFSPLFVRGFGENPSPPTPVQYDVYIVAYLFASWNNAPAALYGTIECDIDLTGQIPPPAIGNGAATPTGVLY